MLIKNLVKKYAKSLPALLATFIILSFFPGSLNIMASFIRNTDGSVSTGVDWCVSTIQENKWNEGAASDKRPNFPGPCIRDNGDLYFDCIVNVSNVVNGKKGLCLQISDDGPITRDCLSDNISLSTEKQAEIDFTSGGFKKNDTCKNILKTVCAYTWETNPLKGCKDVFDNVKPNVTTTDSNVNATIPACQPLTAADKTEIDAFAANGGADKVGTNYSKVCKDAQNKIFADCDKNTTNALCKQGIKLSTVQAQGKTVTDPGSDTNLFDKLLGLVITIVTLLVFIVSTAAYLILSLFAFLFIFFVKINPASNEWIEVAQAPWGVVQSIANLLILASFIFVAFSYILNIKQYKTKIDSFLTNIVIVAIVVQLTLLGAASIINITQGVGDAFVAGYVSIQGGNISNPDDISKAFIGSTVDTFKKVSLVRCRTSYIESPIIKTLASGLGVDVSAQAAPATPPVQTVKQANKASECTNTNDFANISGTTGTIGDAFTKGVGTNLTTLLREVIYLIVTAIAIYAFYKITMLAFTRAIVLWLLMVTSPLALVAFFAPDGLQTKKMADKWGGTFFHYAIFYPAFVFGLILVQELTGAFAKSTANGVNGIANGLQPQKELVTILLGAVVAVGALHLLAEFFEKGAKEISGAAWGGVKAAASVGAAGLRAAAPLAGGAVGGALSFGAKRQESRLNDNISRLESEKARFVPGGTGYTRAEELIKIEKDKLQAVSAKRLNREEIGKNTTKKLTGLANFTEMLPERIEEAEKIPGYIGANWAKQKKARIDSFREGDRLRGELFVRENSKLFGKVGIDADNDPKASLRGVEQDELRESKNNDPDYVKNIVSQGVKSAYAKSLGNDQKIARNLVAKKIARILKEANGDMSKIDPKDWDFVNESLQQHGNDGFVMSQLAQDPKSREMIGYAMDNNYLNTDVQQNLRQRNPIFVTDAGERQSIVSNLSTDDLKDVPGFNFANAEVVAGARSAGMSDQDIGKKYRATGTAPVIDEKGMKADIKSNPVTLSDNGQSRTINMTDEAAARIVNFQRAQSNKDISSQGEILGRIAGERLANPDMTTDQARATYDDVMTKHFGEESAIEAIANDPTMSAQEKIAQLNRGSNNMRAYYQANAAKFATITDKNEVVAEMVAANNKSRESNKSVADLHFQELDQSAKAGKNVLIETNAATAATNLSAAAYGNAAKRGYDAMEDTNFQAEIGVQGYAKNIVKTQVMDPAGSLSSLVDDGLEDTFAHHLESITAASLDGDQNKINNTLRDARTALASNPAAIDYLQEKFTTQDQSGNYVPDRFKMSAVRVEAQAAGQNEIDKMKTKVDDELEKKNLTTETATQKQKDTYAREVFQAREVEAKANSKKAQEKVADKGKAIPYGQASDVIRRNQAPQQTSRTDSTRSNYSVPTPPPPTPPPAVIAPPPQAATQPDPVVVTSEPLERVTQNLIRNSREETMYTYRGEAYTANELRYEAEQGNIDMDTIDPASIAINNPFEGAVLPQRSASSQSAATPAPQPTQVNAPPQAARTSQPSQTSRQSQSTPAQSSQTTTPPPPPRPNPRPTPSGPSTTPVPQSQQPQVNTPPPLSSPTTPPNIQSIRPRPILRTRPGQNLTTPQGSPNVVPPLGQVTGGPSPIPFTPNPNASGVPVNPNIPPTPPSNPGTPPPPPPRRPNLGQ